MAFKRPTHDLTEQDTSLLDAHPRLARIQDWLARHGIRDLTLDKAAELACLERHYFSTVFRKHMNVHFSDWAREYRMQSAAALLRGGIRNIDQVHQDVGFRSRRTFERAFQRRYGLTPARFAKSAGIHDIASPEPTVAFSIPQSTGEAAQGDLPFANILLVEWQQISVDVQSIRPTAVHGPFLLPQRKST